MEEHVLNNVRRFWRVVGSGGGDEREEGRWSSPKDMTRWAGCLTFDIMGDICFSHSFEMLEREENRYILDALPKGVQGLNIVRIFLFFCLAPYLPLPSQPICSLLSDRISLPTVALMFSCI